MFSTKRLEKCPVLLPIPWTTTHHGAWPADNLNKLSKAVHDHTYYNCNSYIICKSVRFFDFGWAMKKDNSSIHSVHFWWAVPLLGCILVTARRQGLKALEAIQWFSTMWKETSNNNNNNIINNNNNNKCCHQSMKTNPLKVNGAWTSWFPDLFRPKKPRSQTEAPWPHFQHVELTNQILLFW